MLEILTASTPDYSRKLSIWYPGSQNLNDPELEVCGVLAGAGGALHGGEGGGVGVLGAWGLQVSTPRKQIQLKPLLFALLCKQINNLLIFDPLRNMGDSFICMALETDGMRLFLSQVSN